MDCTRCARATEYNSTRSCASTGMWGRKILGWFGSYELLCYAPTGTKDSAVELGGLSCTKLRGRVVYATHVSRRTHGLPRETEEG